MKKYISLLLVCMMLFSFCACSKPKTTEQKIPDSKLLITQSEMGFEDVEKNKKYSDFFVLARKGPVIPGLESGYVPQGICILDDKNTAAVSYYSSNGYPSIISLINLENGKTEKAFRLKADELFCYEHVSGLAYDGENLWVCAKTGLYRVSKSELDSVKDGEALELKTFYNLGINTSFCNYASGYLWAGEFYNKDYKTDKSHRFGSNNALAYGFHIGEITKNKDVHIRIGTNNLAIPDLILSLPDEIQGLTLFGDYFAASHSYGRKNNSTLAFYKAHLSGESYADFSVAGVSVPVYYLGNPDKKITNIPMSEGIDLYGENEIIILYESGALKYSENGGKNPTDSLYYFNAQKFIGG